MACVDGPHPADWRAAVSYGRRPAAWQGLEGGEGLRALTKSGRVVVVREHAAKIRFDVGALIPRPSPFGVLTAFRLMRLGKLGHSKGFNLPGNGPNWPVFPSRI